MNILIRTDSSFSIGTGHVMRDLVLAKQYPNDNLIFVTQNLEGNINNKIIEANYPLRILDTNNVKELNTLIKKLKIDMLIIDHYGIDYKKEKKLKKSNPNLKLMVLDDTYEKHHCDILLNHNISANSKRYKNKVPNTCQLKCGKQFTLLRDEFYSEKKKLKKKRKSNIKTIFIAMGGADTARLNIPILKLLKSFSNLKIELVTTDANKEIKQLQNYTKNKKLINLHINSNKIASLMSKSDLAIVTPSVTVNEVYFMEVSFIAIKTAKNQNDIYKYLKKKRFSTMEKFNKNNLVKLLHKILG
jgi:UDP-2,4-diacetamido-2,4,6-trideoxy-beta-L-altropyranose hydrolase